MMLRSRLVICLLLIFATACVPITSDTADSQAVDGQTAGSTEASDVAHEAGEPSDEDAGEHDREDETEHREHGAHVHGAAVLLIAWSSSEMAIDLETPAYNVLGFEHAPASDEEQTLLEESVAALEAGDLLQLNPDAECTVVSADVQTTLSEEEHAAEEEHEEEGHEEEEHEEEVHSDIDVAYTITCQQPENIASVDASALFAQFPNFEEIEVQWVSDTQQSAADLTPENPVILFK
jgi:hypothetical protein